VTGSEPAGVLPLKTDVLIDCGGPAALRLIDGVVREAMAG
jgi:hypothetical protein